MSQITELPYRDLPGVWNPVLCNALSVPKPYVKPKHDTPEPQPRLFRGFGNRSRGRRRLQLALHSSMNCYSAAPVAAVSRIFC